MSTYGSISDSYLLESGWRTPPGSGGEDQDYCQRSDQSEYGETRL